MKTLKRFSAAILAMLVLSASTAIFATGAFEQLSVNDAELIDSTVDQGGNNQPIAIVDGYGVGYSMIDDYVVFHDVDFGANGAKAMTIFFSYGNDDGSETTLDILLDKEDGTLITQYSIGYTGGWESTAAKEFTNDCLIPSGTHDIYVKFTNTMSGSFTWVSFTEADPVIVEEPAAEAPATEEAPAETAAAPQTSDASLVVLSAAAAAAAGAVVLAKKKH